MRPFAVSWNAAAQRGYTEWTPVGKLGQTISDSAKHRSFRVPQSVPNPQCSLNDLVDHNPTVDYKNDPPGKFHRPGSKCKHGRVKRGGLARTGWKIDNLWPPAILEDLVRQAILPRKRFRVVEIPKERAEVIRH